MNRWTLEYDQEVAHYLIALREGGAEIRQAVKSLQNGIPDDARKIQDTPETWEWLEARHWITFVVEASPQWIYVAEVSEISTVV